MNSVVGSLVNPLVGFSEFVPRKDVYRAFFCFVKFSKNKNLAEKTEPRKGLLQALSECAYG